jgi:hypothetical protein
VAPVSGAPRFDWHGHLLGLLAAGAVGWFFEATDAFTRGSSDANWAAPLAVYLVGATGLHLLRRLRSGGERTGLTTGEMHAERLAEAEARLDQLEAAHARINELEERLEFAERLLANGSSQAVPAHELEPPR